MTFINAMIQNIFYESVRKLARPNFLKKSKKRSGRPYESRWHAYEGSSARDRRLAKRILEKTVHIWR